MNCSACLYYLYCTFYVLFFLPVTAFICIQTYLTSKVINLFVLPFTKYILELSYLYLNLGSGVKSLLSLLLDEHFYSYKLLYFLYGTELQHFLVQQMITKQNISK